MIRDDSQETLREIAGRAATKHKLAVVEVKRRDPARADDRVPIVEFRGRVVIFYLARYLALLDCMHAEFRVRGSSSLRGAASLREDLQQELTAVLADRACCTITRPATRRFNNHCGAADTIVRSRLTAAAPARRNNGLARHPIARR
jgi:hypothetical protein